MSLIKCVRIFVLQDIDEAFTKDVVQKYARKLSLEGIALSSSEGSIRISVCGKKDSVDEFVDIMHKELAKRDVEEIEVEPFIKDKDYRGVFRVIE